LDPLFTASPAYGISTFQLSHWDEAYVRGNHALMGYLTGESDPIWSAASGNYYTKTQIDAQGYLTGQLWNQSGTSINYLNGNIGIGINSPAYGIEYVKNNLGATSSEYLGMSNKTDASVGTPVQASPALLLESASWNTTTGVSKKSYWKLYSKPT